jgi:thioredoxin-like negative regulator of GroEL
MKEVTFEEFEEIIKGEKSVVVFSATWCSPCKTLASAIEELDPTIGVYKVDVDKESELASAFNVKSIPSVFKIEEGIVIDSFNGMPAREALVEFLEIA